MDTEVSPPPDRFPSRKELAYLAPALLAALLVYGGALRGEFVYDDNDLIVGNPWVHEIRYLPETILRPVWAYHTTEPTNYYRPLPMGLCNLLWAAFGGAPFPYHAVNLLLHLACTALVFLLARERSKDLWTAASASLLFAVHPLNTEAVAWISCLPELSYAFLVLTALFLHGRAGSGTAPHRRRLKAAAVAAYSLGLFSKETAVVLLPLLLLMELPGRPGEDEAAGEPGARPSTRGGRSIPLVRKTGRVTRALLPYALATIGYLLVRLAAVGGMAPRGRSDLTAADAILNAPFLLLKYGRAMIAPTRLLAFHVLDRVPSFTHPLFLGSVLGLAIVGFLLLRLTRGRPDLRLAAALTALPLLPVLYIPALGENAFGERYAYLPTAGATWLAGAALAGVMKRISGPRGRVIGIGALALLVVPGALRARSRSADWHDDLRLAEATLRIEPRAWQAHVVRANWYYRRNRLEDALAAFERGLAAFPDNPHLQLGVTSLRLRLHRISAETGVQELRRMTSEYPSFYEAAYDLGDACLKSDRPAEAEAAFRQALAINPLAAPAREGLLVSQVAQGRAIQGSGQRPDASGLPDQRAREKVLEGMAAERAGRLEEAEASLREALRLNPKSDRALLFLAVVEDRKGEYQAAVDDCRRAISLNPGAADAYQQLGVSALNLGQVGRAIEALEKAASIDPSDKEALNRLGVAYAKAGRNDEARATFEKALALDADFDKARFNLDRLNRGPGAIKNDGKR